MAQIFSNDFRGPSPIIDLAKNALLVVGSIVTTLAIQLDLAKLSMSAGSLTTFAIEIRNTPIILEIHRERLAREVLDLVESGCAGPKYQRGCYENLEYLARMNTEQRTWRLVASDERSTKDRIAAYLLGFFGDDHNIQKLDALLWQWRQLGSPRHRNFMSDERDTLLQKIDIADPAIGSSSETSDLLYSILQSSFQNCHCIEVPHAARLCLTPRPESTYGSTDYLEILFSVNSGVENHQWQQAEVELLSEKVVPDPNHKHKRRRTWTFSSLSNITRQEKLCNLLKKSAKRRSAKIVLQIREGHLRLARGQYRRQKNSSLGQSVPLTIFLKDHHHRMQTFLLAYNVAMSMWQFYDTKWTNIPWTLENLHLVDAAGEAATGVSSTLYLLTNFREQRRDLNWPEYCNEEGVLHRYPKVFALAQLLIDILDRRSSMLKSTLPRYKPQPINQHYITACRYLNDTLRIKYATSAYGTYLDAVEACLKFVAHVETLTGKAATASTVVNRQNVLFHKVVKPIGLWLQKAEGSSDVQETRKTPFISNAGLSKDSKKAPGVQDIFQSPGVASDAHGKSQVHVPPQSETASQSETEAWVKALGEFSESTATLKVVPVRIAVLDTGCSLEAPILDQQGQEHRLMKNWKDWVHETTIPQDEHGHGTRIVSLLLRIAPKAEIHVARVARDMEGLQNATQTIASAIHYAATSWDADIISLSFGFRKRIDCIEQAITQAKNKSGISPIFLAAAANEGSNTGEMFPASLDVVISVRGTDASGKFESRYDPDTESDNTSQRLYGTLGKQVFCGWPEDPAKLDMWMSGCSVATPILAAIVALILQSVDFSEYSFTTEERLKFRSRKGMMKVMEKISVKKENNRWYVSFWKLFDETGKVKLSTLVETKELVDF